MDNEATHRLNANNIWQLCNTFDDRIDDSSSSGSTSTINSSDSGSSNNSNNDGDNQHSDNSCCSAHDPDGFVYPPSNHSSPTVVGVAIKRSLKVTDSDLEATKRIVCTKNQAMPPPNVLVDCSAPIVDFDADECDERENDVDDENEGADVFYECNNNNTTVKNIALFDAKRHRTLCAAAVDLISNGNHAVELVDIPKSQPNLIADDSLTDLFMKKYHAHNELIENNYYCINTKKIEETINLIDLNDDDDETMTMTMTTRTVPAADAVVDGAVLQPVVIDTRPKPQVPKSTKAIATINSDVRVKHNGPKINGNSGHHNLHVHKKTTIAKEASLLDLSDDSIGKAVDSLLGDTVCTNHLLANVREDFERLKVNVSELNGQFGSDTIDGNDNTPQTKSNTSDQNNSFQQQNESDSSQLVNSIINQCATNNSQTKQRHQPHQQTIHFSSVAVDKQQRQPGRTPPILNDEEPDIVKVIDIDVVHGKMLFRLFFLLLLSVCACLCVYKRSSNLSDCLYSLVRIKYAYS